MTLIPLPDNTHRVLASRGYKAEEGLDYDDKPCWRIRWLGPPREGRIYPGEPTRFDDFIINHETRFPETP